MDEEFQEAYDLEQGIGTEGTDNLEGTEPEVQEIQEVSDVQDAPEETEEQSTEPQKIAIEGLGEFTLDELKEFKNGYMRQSDYTRKTQEIARQRKEIEELQTRPNLANQSPVAQRMQAHQPNELELRIMQLEESVADKELDSMITTLKQKYPDFDEVKVLNTAYEKGITDLEFVYKSIRETENVDMNSIKEQVRQELMKEIQQNKGLTNTIIADGNAPIQNKQVNLSNQELAIAKELGLTPTEYLEYK